MIEEIQRQTDRQTGLGGGGRAYKRLSDRQIDKGRKSSTVIDLSCRPMSTQGYARNVRARHHASQYQGPVSWRPMTVK